MKSIAKNSLVAFFILTMISPLGLASTFTAGGYTLENNTWVQYERYYDYDIGNGSRYPIGEYSFGKLKLPMVVTTTTYQQSDCPQDFTLVPGISIQERYPAKLTPSYEKYVPESITTVTLSGSVQSESFKRWDTVNIPLATQRTLRVRNDQSIYYERPLPNGDSEWVADIKLMDIVAKDTQILQRGRDGSRFGIFENKNVSVIDTNPSIETIVICKKPAVVVSSSSSSSDSSNSVSSNTSSSEESNSSTTTTDSSSYSSSSDANSSMSSVFSSVMTSSEASMYSNNSSVSTYSSMSSESSQESSSSSLSWNYWYTNMFGF